MQGFLEFAPANAIFRLPPLVRSIIDSIFVMVFSLLAYSVARFRRRDDHDNLTILENGATAEATQAAIEAEWRVRREMM
jgi:heme/copper-type cytochrome/quinol oxidase subunit 2